MRSFKKIAAMTIAVAMLCSFTALGASVEIGDIADTSSANPTTTLDYTADGVAQVSMIVYQGDINSNANVVYVDQRAANADKPSITLPADSGFGTYNILMGGSGLDAAVSGSFEHVNLRTGNDVSIAVTNGYVKHNLAGTPTTEDGVMTFTEVEDGTSVTLNLSAYLGYELTTFTVNGTSEINAVEGGAYTFEVSEDTAIVATFTAIDAASSNYIPYTSAEIYDIDSEENEDDRFAGKSKLSFGKAVAIDGDTLLETGMLVEVQVTDEETQEKTWDEFTTTGKGQKGPYFAAANRTGDNQFGIRFFGFTQGTYRVCAYAKYENAGLKVDSENAIVFTVE